MNHVRRQLTRLHLWAVLLVLGAFQVAHAQGTATVNIYQNGTFGNHTSVNAALAAVQTIGPTLASQCGAPIYATIDNHVLNSSQLIVYYSNYRTNECGIAGPGSLVGTSSATFGIVTGSGTLPCPEAGTKKIINVTAGYVTSANGSADVLNLPSLVTRIGQTMCASAGGSSCSYTIGQPVDSWSSTQPTTTGLYRISDDWEMTSTGNSCSPTAQETATTDATAAPPACPGAFGTVNGKPVCVPTAGGSTSKPAASTTNRAGNPSAGSDGTQPIGNRSPTTGTNNANNGSAPAPTDGTPLGARDTGIPPAAGTSSGSGGGTVNVEVGDIPTDCDKKPTSIGCSEYGTPDNGVSLSQLDSGFGGITPVAFGTSSGCPVPASFTVSGTSYDISFQPICDGAESYIRPIVLVLGAAAAAFIFVGGFRS